jgi:hypothetical protein
MKNLFENTLTELKKLSDSQKIGFVQLCVLKTIRHYQSKSLDITFGVRGVHNREGVIEAKCKRNQLIDMIASPKPFKENEFSEKCHNLALCFAESLLTFNDLYFLESFTFWCCQSGVESIVNESLYQLTQKHECN